MDDIRNYQIALEIFSILSDLDNYNQKDIHKVHYILIWKYNTYVGPCEIISRLER